MPPDPDALRETLTRAAELEREWMGRDPGTSSRYLPWMPFSIPAYVALLAEALPEAPGNRFLEIGCGIGTKMLIAQELFGLDVTGVEIARTYVRQSVMPTHILLGDAADCNYSMYDLIWFYRPLRDPDFQAGLEKIVWDRMAPGAVVICAALEAPPPPDRFIAVLDDWEIQRGIWMKPPRPPVA